MYELKRIRDSKTTVGKFSRLLWEDERGKVKVGEEDSIPKVGFALIVGKMVEPGIWHDWWHTSCITEILEEKDGYVRFRTLNSVYVWRKLEN